MSRPVFVGKEQTQKFEKASSPKCEPSSPKFEPLPPHSLLGERKSFIPYGEELDGVSTEWISMVPKDDRVDKARQEQEEMKNDSRGNDELVSETWEEDQEDREWGQATIFSLLALLEEQKAEIERLQTRVEVLEKVDW